MEKMLDGTILILPVLVYMFTSIFQVSNLISIIMNIGFCIILLIVIIKPLLSNYSVLNEKKHVPYYFLYFGSCILLIQNSLIILMHTLNLLNVSSNPLLVSFSFGVLNTFSRFYKIAFYLDILAYILLLAYLIQIKPVENKETFRKLGIIGAISFILTTITWRTISGFWVIVIYEDWLQNELTTVIKSIWLLSQVGLLCYWYGFGRLQLVKSSNNSTFTENQVNSRNNYFNLSFTITVLYAIFAGFLLMNLISSIDFDGSTFVRINLAIKGVFIPTITAYLNLKIFQKYNLLI